MEGLWYEYVSEPFSVYTLFINSSKGLFGKRAISPIIGAVLLRFLMLPNSRVGRAASARRLNSKQVLKISAAVLGFATLSLAQTGSQISISPGIITTVASNTNQALAAAVFNGVATRSGVLYVSDSHVTGYSNAIPIKVANVYSIDVTSGQVNRIAGTLPDQVNGNSGYSGDGGQATDAKLNQPAGLAFDNAGNLYVADAGQNVVRKIDMSTKIITTVAGNGNTNPANGVFGGDGGAATSAQLLFPTALSFDSSNNLYISDTLNARIRMVSASSGVITTIVGNGTHAHSGDNGPAVNAGLDQPQGIAVDKNNDLYIADSTSNVNSISSPTQVVRKVSNGIITTVATQFFNPYDVSVDPGGTVYISDTSQNKIFRLSTNGQVTPVAGNGSTGSTGDGGPALSAAITTPASLAVSTTGDLYFVQSSSVRRVTALPAPVTFPLTAVNSSNSQTVTISATGDQPLTVSQMNPPAGFTITGGSCGAAPFTLSAGTSCTLVLTITPTNGGSTSGTLNIVSNAVNSASTAVFLSMSNGLYFIPVSPCRLVDTRWPNGAYGGPFLTAEQTRNFIIRNSSNSGSSFPGACSSAPVPSGADVQAYALNVTVVPKGSLRWLTVSPSNSSIDPNAVSNLNAYDGRTKANAVIVPADTSNSDRAISVFAKDATDVIIDINGYYVPQSNANSLAFYPVQPCRAVDTRDGARGSGLGVPSMGANETRTYSLQSSTCGLPSSAQAYALNFTAVPKSNKIAYITVWPNNGQSQPIVSTLNATTGAVTANAAIVPVGSNGQVSVFTTDPADLIIDVSGYYAPPGTGGLALYNVTPCRAWDSRGSNGTDAPVNGASYHDATGGNCAGHIPATAQDIVMNATVVPAASLSYLTLWARGAAQPLQSTLNAYDAAVTSNLAVVPTTDGNVAYVVTAPTGLLFDVFGYFAP